MDENRRTIAMRLPPELLERLGEWCRSQRPPVTKTGVVEMLLEDFLKDQERKGWRPIKGRK